MGIKDHKPTRAGGRSNWAIHMIQEIPSLRPLLKPSSWTVLFPPRKIKTTEELNNEYEQKYANVSLRDEQLEKIKEKYGSEESEGVGRESKTMDVRLDTLSFSEFFDRAHKVCSEIGKFLPYKDDAKLREERISAPGDRVYAKWKGSSEYYPATVLFGNAPTYSVSYESGEYDAHVNSEFIIYPEEFKKLQAGDPEFRTGK